MGEFIERHYPWFIGFVAGVGFWWLNGGWIPPGLKDLLSGFLNVASIVVGFLVTAKSILLSIDHKWIIQRSKESGAYGMLVGYIVSATYWWLASALLSAVGVAIIPPDPLADWQQPIAVGLFSGWLFVSVTSALGTIRVLSIYSKILKSISKG